MNSFNDFIINVQCTMLKMSYKIMIKIIFQMNTPTTC